MDELRTPQADKAKKNSSDEIRMEQVRLAFKDLPTMQTASFIVALVLSWLIWKIVPPAHIFAWDLLILGVVASRIMLYYRFLRVRNGSFAAEDWQKRFLVLSLISGTVWGLSAFMIFPVCNVGVIAIFLLALASLAAATTITHAAIRTASASWAVPALLLYAAHCVVMGGAPDYTLAFLTVLYLLAVLRLSLIHNKNITSAITLKFENLDLIENVKKANEHLSQDIFRRKQAEKALNEYRQELERLVEKRTAELLETEKRYRLLFEKAHDAIFIIDAEGPDSGRIVAANETAASMHGYTVEELLKMSIMDVDSPEDARLSVERRALIMKGQWLHAVINHRKKDGTIFPVEISSGLMEQGGHKYFFAIERDVTERRKTDEKIAAALKEKEVLLKEVYHRTKNNMQVISSLLGLQAAAVEDRLLQRAFKEMQDRIRAMSLVHEELYESTDLSNLDMKRYLEALALGMKESYIADTARISIDVEAESIPLSIDLAIPCGLIINELLANSLKYAFPGWMTGSIRIGLHRTSGDELELAYSDNGIGLPEGLDIKTTKTLGLRLVNNLVASQLRGTLQVHRENGAAFVIRFSSTVNHG